MGASVGAGTRQAAGGRVIAAMCGDARGLLSAALGCDSPRRGRRHAGAALDVPPRRRSALPARAGGGEAAGLKGAHALLRRADQHPIAICRRCSTPGRAQQLQRRPVSPWRPAPASCGSGVGAAGEESQYRCDPSKPGKQRTCGGSPLDAFWRAQHEWLAICLMHVPSAFACHFHTAIYRAASLFKPAPPLNTRPTIANFRLEGPAPRAL